MTLDELEVCPFCGREKVEWISVKDRLPEKDGEYVVYVQYPHVHLIMIISWASNYKGFYPDLKGRAVWYDYDSEYGDCEITDVTHWMELPTPPEGV